MDTVIRQSKKPIVDILIDSEIIVGSPDPDIEPLHILKGGPPEYRVLARFAPTDEQRQAILQGADIYLSLLTYGQPIQPVLMFASTELDEANVVEILQLDPKVEM